MGGGVARHELGGDGGAGLDRRVGSGETLGTESHAHQGRTALEEQGAQLGGSPTFKLGSHTGHQAPELPGVRVHQIQPESLLET